MKRTLTGIVAASMVLGTMAPAAFAATASSSYHWGQKTVAFNGQTIATPWAFATNTTYFPIYYLQQMVKGIAQGATTGWDGTNLTINIPGLNVAQLNTSNVGVGGNGIYVNGVLVQKFTKIVTFDHGTKVATSYAPIYDLFPVLKQLGFNSQWLNTGTLWSVSPAQTGLSINGNNSISATGTDALTLTAMDANGNVVTVPSADVQWSATGGVIDQNGNFASGTPGTYTITAKYDAQTATATVVVYGTPASVKLTASNSTLAPNTGATSSLTATVTDANGNPVPGVKVNFATSNASILSVPSVATTNANGNATVVGVEGTQDGTATVVATVSGTGLASSANVSVQQIAPVSVSQLNADQLQVVFNEPVLAADANTISNYSITTPSTNYATGATAQLQSDGKTVVITFGSNVPANGTVLAVQVSNIHDANDVRVLPTYATSLTLNDSAAPAISSVKAATNGIAAGTLTVDFTEPVNTSASTPLSFAIDGTTYTGTPMWSNNNTEVTFSGLTLDATKSHTFSAYNVTDYAGNVSNVLTQSFSVTTDTTKPTVGVSAINDHQIELTFSKAVTGVTTGNVQVTYASGTTDNTTSIVADPTDTTGTKYILSLNDPTGTLYAAQSSRTFNVSFNGNITDSAGNAMTPVTDQITLYQDTTAPVLQSLSYDMNTAGTQVADIVVHASKGLAAYAANALTNGVQVIQNSTGADVTSGFFTGSAAVNAGDQTVTLDVNGANVSNGQYTINFPKGWVTDDSNNANASAATSLTLTVNNTSNGFSLAESNIATATSPNRSTGVEQFVVTYPQAVTASATNLSNYTLNGMALPSGTVITLDNSTNEVATFTLPEGAVAADGNETFTVNNVQSQSGQTITPFSGYVSVLDNTQPVLQSAQIVDSTHIILTFNEAMYNHTGSDVSSQLKIVNGGQPLAGTVTFDQLVAGNPNQVEITLPSALDLTQATTVTTLAPGLYPVLCDADASAYNGVAGGTTVTATGN